MTLPEKPYFDMELFLQTASESRLDGSEAEECLALWNRWSELLRYRTVTAAGKNFLAIWLEKSVEEEIDVAWENSPSKAFRMNALAQTLVMCAVHDRVPEVADAGCAPVPHPSEELANTLQRAGLPAANNAGLHFALRYVVVTPEPFRGGCEICSLRPSCPRSGAGEGSMIEIG